MKKILLYLFIISLTSCSKILEENPKDRLFTKNFYKTKDDANAAIYSIYDPMRDPNCYGGLFVSNIEGMSDYANATGVYQTVAAFKGLNSANIAHTDGMWRLMYQSINFSNLALKYIPAIPMQDAEKNALLAEARFLRAFNYYNLVRNWGPVPVRMTAIEDLSSTGGKRAPVADIYKLIVDDLKFAETNLPETPLMSGRPTIWSAKTFLAEVYLVLEKWTDARDKAEEVITAKKFALQEVVAPADFEKLFGPDATTTSEEIFSFKFTRVETEGSRFVIFFHLPACAWAAGGLGPLFAVPTSTIISSWDNNDLRKTFTLYDKYPNKSGVIVNNAPAQPLRFGKFKDANAQSGAAHGNDLPVFRYADALLIYAEATGMAPGGPTPLAMERLNQVKRRGYGLPSATPNPAVDYQLGNYDATAFRALVLKERAYEFMSEAKRWFDLKRTNTVKAALKASRNVDVADLHLFWPLPIQELNNNPDMGPADQNPGY